MFIGAFIAMMYWQLSVGFSSGYCREYYTPTLRLALWHALRVTPPLGARGPAYGGEYYTPTLRWALWHAFRQHTRGPRPSPVRPNHRPALSRVRDLKPIPPLVQHTSRDYPLHHKYNNNNFLLPAKQKTAQFLAFLFCFTRELNLYTPVYPPIPPPTPHPPIPPPPPLCDAVGGAFYYLVLRMQNPCRRQAIIIKPWFYRNQPSTLLSALSLR